MKLSQRLYIATLGAFLGALAFSGVLLLVAGAVAFVTWSFPHEVSLARLFVLLRTVALVGVVVGVSMALVAKDEP